MNSFVHKVQTFNDFLAIEINGASEALSNAHKWNRILVITNIVITSSIPAVLGLDLFGVGKEISIVIGLLAAVIGGLIQFFNYPAQIAFLSEIFHEFLILEKETNFYLNGVSLGGDEEEKLNELQKRFLEIKRRHADNVKGFKKMSDQKKIETNPTENYEL
ncbi:hypothetical protein [Brevibacillus sp. FIR094]|uniref:hypothetical protein n=1 Tax=Brevibacillus sp. FIR094 TaxID=3134809 RepID=UPI003D226F35